MSIAEIIKYRLTCDGRYPDNHGPCPCSITVEVETQQQAIDEALRAGWTLHKRGVIDVTPRLLCNAKDGHREDA